MNKKWAIGLVVAGLLGLTSHMASATLIAIDADPGTVGIQTMRTVTPGAMFTVDVVLDTTGDAAPTIFDTTILGVSFNDAGAVLNLGPTGPVAPIGGLATPFFTFDIFGGFVQIPALPHSLGTGPSLPAAGFASASGHIGLFEAPYFSFPIGVVPGGVTTIFSLDFTAGAAPGMSTLSASNTAGSELALFGGPVPAGLQTATLTVQGAALVPEPGALLLLGTGLFGVALTMRRHRA